MFAGVGSRDGDAAFLRILFDRLRLYRAEARQNREAGASGVGRSCAGSRRCIELVFPTFAGLLESAHAVLSFYKSSDVGSGALHLSRGCFNQVGVIL